MRKDELLQNYIETINSLKLRNEYLLKKLKVWYELLKLDGSNTKHQVIVDIESILKEVEMDG